MSTIKSSDEHLTLNADGSSKDIKFQANGVEKASISSSGAFTSTTIDATKLTGDLPAISGAALTGVGVAGISSSADATAITITSAESVGIGTATPVTPMGSDKCLEISDNSSVSLVIDDTRHTNPWTIRNSGGVLSFNMGTTTALSLTDDGVRGVSKFTAKAWCKYNDTTIHSSHNISSMTDVETGVSKANYSTNMVNTDYSAVASCHSSNCDKHGPYIMETNVAYLKILSLLKTNCDYADSITYFQVFGE